MRAFLSIFAVGALLMFNCASPGFIDTGKSPVTHTAYVCGHTGGHCTESYCYYLDSAPADRPAYACGHTDGHCTENYCYYSDSAPAYYQKGHHRSRHGAGHC